MLPALLAVPLDKLAEMRRIVEDSARTALSSKKYTPEQHALIKENLEIVRKVIPFDQGDIDKAVKTGSGKPGAVEGADKSLTFTEFAQKHAIHDRAAPQAGAQSPQDKAALEWATANPADPRSDQIKKRLGM